MVECGCFHGNLEEFRSAIRRTHDKNGMLSPLGDEYMDIVNLMEKRFKRVLLERAKYYEKYKPEIDNKFEENLSKLVRKTITKSKVI